MYQAVWQAFNIHRAEHSPCDTGEYYNTGFYGPPGRDKRRASPRRNLVLKKHEQGLSGAEVMGAGRTSIQRKECPQEPVLWEIQAVTDKTQPIWGNCKWLGVAGAFSVLRISKG